MSSKRTPCVKRYACPVCGVAYGFNHLNGVVIRSHSVKRGVLCLGSGQLPVPVAKEKSHVG